MKCIVLDYEKAEVNVFSYDKTQDIEEILTENYGTGATMGGNYQKEEKIIVLEVERQQ